ncbi:MAG TPA: hypothetical protein VHJ34_06900 [Actinomycetota bacterium]|nr:hypothetical protein [Actinomycetota bacterium]
MAVRVAACLLAAALLPSCSGGEEEIDASTYAARVCGALDDWVSTLRDASEDVESAVADAAQPADAKEPVVAFLERYAGATNAVVEDVRAVGPPAVEDGERVHDELVEALERAASRYEDELADARALPSDSSEEFQAAYGELVASHSEVESELRRSIDVIDAEGELADAFDDEPSCADTGL